MILRCVFDNVVVFQNVLTSRKVAGLDFFCALSIAPDRIFWSIGSSSSMPSVSIMF